jgi:hypothetical protein
LIGATDSHFAGNSVGRQTSDVEAISLDWMQNQAPRYNFPVSYFAVSHWNRHMGLYVSRRILWLHGFHCRMTLLPATAGMSGDAESFKTVRLILPGTLLRNDKLGMFPEDFQNDSFQ